MKHRTIAQVLAPATYGGLESVVVLLTRGLSERGHRVPVVLVLDDEPNPHPFEEALRARPWPLAAPSGAAGVSPMTSPSTSASA